MYQLGIKMEVGWLCVLIHLAQDKSRWRVLVNTAMDNRFRYRSRGGFFKRCISLCTD
jgi:hypothetical protein